MYATKAQTEVSPGWLESTPKVKSMMDDRGRSYQKQYPMKVFWQSGVAQHSDRNCRKRMTDSS